MKKHKSAHQRKSQHHNRSHASRRQEVQTPSKPEHPEGNPAPLAPVQQIHVEEKSLQKDVSLLLSLVSIKVIDAQPGACFANALDLFLRGMPQWFVPGGRFIEGWFVIERETDVVLNEHGWCQLEDGTIIDPSVFLSVPAHQPVFYFAGVKRGWREMCTLMTGEGMITFPYVRFDGRHGSDGMGHPGYKAAYEAACRKVEQLAGPTNKTKKLLRAQDIDPTTLALLNAGVEVITLSPSDDPQ